MQDTGANLRLPMDEAALMDVVRLRVRYSEGDQMGITYHARYLDWFAIGRTELLRTLGLSYAQLERDGVLLPVLEANCRYVGATRYDDVVQLETRLTEVGRTRMTFHYEVWRLAPKQESDAAAKTTAKQREELQKLQVEKPVLVTIGETKHAFIDARHQPIDVRKRFPEVWQVLRPLADQLQSAVGDNVVAKRP